MTDSAPMPWDHLYIDGHLATMECDGKAYGAVESAALAVQGDRIAWLGPMAALPGAPEDLAAQVTRLHGHWVTPGLIDCHTHLVHGGNRAREFEMRLQGASYAEVAAAGGGIVSTVRATRETEDEDLFKEAMLRLTPLTQEGVTTVEIKSGYGLDTETELRMLRVARSLGAILPTTIKTTFLGAHAIPPDYKDRADAYIDLVCDEMLSAAVREDLVDAVDAFCETIAFDAAQTARVFDAARRHGLPVKLHADQLSDCGGGALAARYGALSADHVEYISDAGIAAMAGAGTVAVMLPAAFFTLRETQLPPIQKFRDAGVALAVATDANPGSAPCTSLLTAMNMACVLFRMTPEEVLAGVTRVAAQALGMAETHGTLAVGKAADFAVWAVETPAELAYRIGFNPCRGAVKAGLPMLPIRIPAKG